MIKPLNKLPNKKTKKGFPKFNLFQKILIFIGLMIIAFTSLPIVIVLFFGLLPTLTIVVTDTKNINNIPSCDYAPVSVTGSFDTFKEYVTKTSIYSLYGKTHNNIRYIFYNGHMYLLNLLTKEFKKIAQ